MKPKVVCIHLLNDYSGSPLILLESITAMKSSHVEIDLYVGKGGEGFLSQAPCNKYYFPYQRSTNRLITLFSFFYSQIYLLIKLLWKYKKQHQLVIYVNTILPFGAALAGRLMRAKVIYHIHEISIQPAILKSFLKRIISLTANKAIFVSDTLKKLENIPSIKQNQRIYNPIPRHIQEFINGYVAYHRYENRFRILMVCSLKTYKGVYEFINLAKLFYEYKDIDFTLVLNATEAETFLFVSEVGKVKNLTIYPVHKDLVSFYRETSLVINMSRPNKWIETFGMTLVEAMSFGIPVIAPPVGGPTELVDHGWNGYLVSCYELEKLKRLILKLYNDCELWQQLSKNAKQSVQKFSYSEFVDNIVEAVIND